MFDTKKQALAAVRVPRVIVYYKSLRKWKAYQRVSPQLRRCLFVVDFAQFCESEKDKSKTYFFEV
jgi:hypothetical protein